MQKVRKDDIMHMNQARVLIIDDSPEVNEVLQEFLESKGCKVVTSTDGAEGLQLAMANQFSLALVDIRMPGLMGDEILATMKKLFQSMPVIMITGHQDDETAKRCMELGAYDFITKPFDFKYLETSVLSAIFVA